MRPTTTLRLLAGIEPITEAVTPHSLRRLYASLRYALRDDPVYVAEQMGHADGGGLSMATYAKAVRRRARLSGSALREFDAALQWAEMGRIAAEAVPSGAVATEAGPQELALPSLKSPASPDSSVG